MSDEHAHTVNEMRLRTELYRCQTDLASAHKTIADTLHHRGLGALLNAYENSVPDDFVEGSWT